MGMGGQRHAPPVLPPGKTEYPLNTRLGGPQGWCGQVRKISLDRDLIHQTFQVVARRYIDYTIPANLLFIYTQKLVNLAL